MAEKILDDSDQGYDYTSSLYLTKDKNSIVLEVEGAPRPGFEDRAHNIQEIYLSQTNLQLLINALNYHLYTMEWK